MSLAQVLFFGTMAALPPDVWARVASFGAEQRSACFTYLARGIRRGAASAAQVRRPDTPAGGPLAIPSAWQDVVSDFEASQRLAGTSSATATGVGVWLRTFWFGVSEDEGEEAEG